MKRSRLAPGKPLARTTPLERTSRLRSSGPTKAKRPTVTPEERKARRIVKERSGGDCEIRLPRVCTGRATDWSHRIAKGRCGKWEASNGLHSCRGCHEAITNTNGARAQIEILGYIVRTGADTREVPVYRCQRWVLLDDEGGITDGAVAA